MERVLRVGVPALGRLGGLECSLAWTERVVMIIVAVVVVRRAGSAEMDVGASAASVVVDDDPRPGHGDGRDEGSERGRREALDPGTADHPRGARSTGIS